MSPLQRSSKNSIKCWLDLSFTSVAFTSWRQTSWCLYWQQHPGQAHVWFHSVSCCYFWLKMDQSKPTECVTQPKNLTDVLHDLTASSLPVHGTPWVSIVNSSFWVVLKLVFIIFFFKNQNCMPFPAGWCISRFLIRRRTWPRGFKSDQGLLFHTL